MKSIGIFIECVEADELPRPKSGETYWNHMCRPKEDIILETVSQDYAFLRMCRYDYYVDDAGWICLDTADSLCLTLEAILLDAETFSDYFEVIE